MEESFCCLQIESDKLKPQLSSKDIASNTRSNRVIQFTHTKVAYRILILGMIARSFRAQDRSLC